jgi:hypothetical protein
MIKASEARRLSDLHKVKFLDFLNIVNKDIRHQAESFGGNEIVYPFCAHPEDLIHRVMCRLQEFGYVTRVIKADVGVFNVTISWHEEAN